MNNYVIIFIDGFPYELRERLNFLNRFSVQRSLTPGIGYSVNIHAQLFAGLSADQIGFFNTWKFQPQNSPFKMLGNIKILLSSAGNNRYLNRIFRMLIALVCRYDSLNIPYKYIDQFAPCGYTIDSDTFPAPKILPQHVFTKIDSVAHKFGINSQEYDDCIHDLNSWVTAICDTFTSACPDGHIVIFSDHGMSKVKHAIQLNLERDFSSNERLQFVYFLDTTMLRVWYSDLKVKNALESFLQSKDYGRLLTDQERIEFGIHNKEWADSIFLLDEGYVFDPSFLEKGSPHAMHGYDPRSRWQKGIFLYSGPKAFAQSDTVTTSDCYHVLKEITKSEKT